MIPGVRSMAKGLDELISADLSALDAPAVLDLARELETAHRRLAAVGHRVVAEIESRRIAGDYARSTTADLLVHELRLAPAEARARAARAEELGPRRTLGGEPLPPLLPACAAASSDGEIGPDHVAVIASFLDAAPPSLDACAIEILEATLVESARHEHPQALRRTAALLLARLDADGVEPREQEHERRRDVTLSRNLDGSGRLTGRLTVEATMVWDAILDALSAPVPAEDGTRDERTAGQRRHDAVVEAGQRLLRSSDLPSSGGVPVTIVVRTTAADLADRSGVAVGPRGDVQSLVSLAPACGDAELVPIDVDSSGAVLRLGRTRRLASRAQRLALAARDGGCTFPACERPAAWTEVHHVIAWQDGGVTDIDNMCLVCRFHHREFERKGWAVQMTVGVPEWIPPPFIDPARRPRRNRAHHPPEIDFGLDRVAA